MASMLKGTLLLLSLGVVLLCLVTPSSSTKCATKKYGYKGYTYYYRYCSGSCCGDKCCRTTSYYRYSYGYSGFGILPIIIIACCWCRRKKQRDQALACRRNNLNVAVVSTQYGVGNPGFSQHPSNTTGTAPASAPGLSGNSDFMAAPPAYSEVTVHPPPYSSLTPQSDEKKPAEGEESRYWQIR